MTRIQSKPVKLTTIKGVGNAVECPSCGSHRLSDAGATVCVANPQGGILIWVKPDGETEACEFTREYRRTSMVVQFVVCKSCEDTFEVVLEFSKANGGTMLFLRSRQSMAPLPDDEEIDLNLR